MAMSMFSVVGILGMAGIIINDSIVLVTTVDQYARERGLIPSIVDAACDRLRPVLLTTLTTILGLAPLLFERSSQALFLKPTVVTLVYGLGFGMLLVLLIVPALLAVGHDLGRMGRSMRRSLGLTGQPVGGGVRAVPRLALALVALAFAGTLGWYLATGTPGPLTIARAEGAAGMLASFAAIVALGLAALWLVGAALVLRRRET
jgi:predicted RND superfamily exporter protein